MTVVAFDFDGTLSDSEMTVLLGEQCDTVEGSSTGNRATRGSVADRMDGITERAMNDEIAYAESLRQRCALLESLDNADAQAALDAADASVDTIVANRLPVADGALTGDVGGPLIEGTKDDALAVLAAALDEDVDDTVAVGDGANDLPMLEVAGLAVGFAPKPAVEPACDAVVESMAGLRDVLETEELL